MIKKLAEKFMTKEVLMYLIFGVLTTLVNYAVYFLLYDLFHINYLVSHTIAWICAVVFAYFTNKKYVFNDKTEEKYGGIRKFLTFVAGRFLSFIVETVWLIVTVSVFKMDANISKVLAAIFVVIINYFLSKLFVFGNGKYTELLKNTVSNNLYVYITFVAAVFIMLVVYFVYNIVPFGDVTVMRMDLYHQYAPFMSELCERLNEGRSLLYSWYSGLGGGFIGNFANYLGSPLNIISILFGQENVTETISCLVLIKVSLASSLFAYYLKKSNRVNNPSIIAFGVLYGFCGYFVAYYWDIMWMDAFALFPLVVLGIEKIINERKFVLYTLSLFVIMTSNYYMAYMICIFLVIYFFIYFLGKYKLNSRFSDKETCVELVGGTQDIVFKSKRPKGLKALADSRLLSSGAIFAFASIIAAMMAAFLLIPTFSVLQGSSATGNDFPSGLTRYFDIFDFIANHLPSVAPTIRSSGNDVLPNIYCGVLTLILIPGYLLCRKISVREKIFSLGLIAIFFLSFSYNYLNFIWHGFHFPNDLPYRFSFMYSFFLLTLAFKAFSNLEDARPKNIGLISILLGAFVVIVQKIGSKNVDILTVYISLIFIVIYTAVLSVRITKPKMQTLTVWLLVSAVIFEVAVSNTRNYEMDVKKSSYLQDAEPINKIVDMLDETDKSFYRVERISSFTCNDPALFNYRGVSAFSSMASEKLSNLQQYLGVMGNKINSYIYSTNTPIYNSMFALKYLFGTTDLGDDFYTLKDTVDGMYVFENKYYLPIAFCVDNGIENLVVSTTNPFQSQINFVSTAYGSEIEDVFTPLTIDSAEYSNIVHRDENSKPYNGQNSFDKEYYDEFAFMNVKYYVEKSQNVYLFFYSSNVNCIVASYDDFSINPDTSERRIIDIGYVKAGTLINIYIPFDADKGDNGYFYLNAYGFNADSFDDAYNKFKAGGLDVTEFDDTHIKGTVTAEEDCCLYTSIPYDKGWTVKVDSQEVETFALKDSLLYIKMPAGTHTVEFSFYPQGLTLGLLVSGLGLFILIIVLVLLRLLKKSRAAKNADSSSVEPEFEVSLEGCGTLISETSDDLESAPSDGCISEQDDDYEPPTDEEK